ncbi:hypothetical protein H7R52_17480 [Weissella confusa]|uniref:Uncharacterized protein n=1 Tax=Weissella confusa TaxID=1583 RepID=A0A923SP16_WEICO|nr:hypothetical protein [Weissella confusa]
MREFQAHQLRGDAEINAYVLAQLPDGADRTAYLQADFVVIAPSGKTYFSQARGGKHKTAEMVDYLAVLGVEAINYRDLHEQIAFPDETTDDMAQNARVKAQTIHEILPDEYILADDSALFGAKIVMMSNVDVEIADDPSAAITLARRVRESSEALILVTGSFYTLRAIESEGM